MAGGNLYKPKLLDIVKLKLLLSTNSTMVHQIMES